LPPVAGFGEGVEDFELGFGEVDDGLHGGLTRLVEDSIWH